MGGITFAIQFHYSRPLGSGTESVGVSPPLVLSSTMFPVRRQVFPEARGKQSPFPHPREVQSMIGFLDIKWL